MSKRKMMNAKCPECGSTQIRHSKVAGLGACLHCGLVFVPPLTAVVSPPPAKPDLPGVRPVPKEDEVGEAEVVIPDQVECDIGWRSWEVKMPKPGESIVMRSVSKSSQYWTPREPMEALCLPHGTGRANGKKPKDHDIPVESCTCGLHAAKTYKQLISMGYHTYDEERDGFFCVVGRVSLWGKVIEGQQGWRAKIGYPLDLYVPYEAWRLGEPLERAYGVPVLLKNFLSPIGQDDEEEDE